MADWTHFGSHSFCSPSDTAGLLRLDRLPLWQVMWGILLIFSVIGQGSLLQTDKCDEFRTQHINPEEVSFRPLYEGNFISNSSPVVGS